MTGVNGLDKAKTVGLNLGAAGDSIGYLFGFIDQQAVDGAVER